MFNMASNEEKEENVLRKVDVVDLTWSKEEKEGGKDGW